jgi:tetratricopeptide (TPR) repeat protein
MNRFSRVVLTIVPLFYVLILSAQIQDRQQSNFPQPPSVVPPSASSPAEELETTGDSLRARKDYLDAIDYYRAALKKKETASVHNKLGVALLQLSKYNDAKKEFERSVKLDNKYPEAHNNLGVIHYVSRHYGPAIKEYGRAIRIRPENASFHSNLGSAYFSRKDFDKAMREYTRAMEIDPNIFDPSPSGGVAVKLASHGDRAYFHYVIAKMYGSRGDVEHCRLYLSKANEEGYAKVQDALKDEEFAPLRKDPNFVAFVRSLKPPPPLEASN